MRNSSECSNIYAAEYFARLVQSSPNRGRRRIHKYSVEISAYQKFTENIRKDHPFQVMGRNGDTVKPFFAFVLIHLTWHFLVLSPDKGEFKASTYITIGNSGNIINIHVADTSEYGVCMVLITLTSNIYIVHSFRFQSHKTSQTYCAFPPKREARVWPHDRLCLLVTASFFSVWVQTFQWRLLWEICVFALTL